MRSCKKHTGGFKAAHETILDALHKREMAAFRSQHWRSWVWAARGG